jgi:hypothetical protein
MKNSDSIQSTEESLAIITRMIAQTQGNMRGGSFYFILWGWIGMLGFIGHYLLQVYTDMAHPYIIWLIAIPGWIISFVYGARQARNRGVSNYSDKMIMWTWIAFGITLILIIFSGQYYSLISPTIIALAAMATFITGVIIKFKPLIYGAGSLWVFAAVALAVTPTTGLLVCALAVLTGYLIPGYMLKNIA